ncbi:hypothetical protein FACS1894190_13280 [Spirochaetia bacterium]|nr:hypothetical protein FACS1894190_13280 [Spirochaetia bacterium]GHV19575.1 hypothetical protein FACS189494_01550 [Spirochaetia bacterium]
MKHKSLTALAAVLVFTSCAAGLRGEIKSDGSAALDFSSSLLPSIGRLIRQAQGINTSGTVILNAAEINNSFEKAPGVKSVKFQTSQSDTLEGPIVIEKIDAFLEGTKAKFINWKSSPAGGSFEVVLNRENGALILSQISPDVTDYISTLMAPIATGEILTKKEYLSLLTDVYGKKMADEITAAFFNVSLIFPSTVRRVTGGKSQGRTASFSVPLCDMLVLEKPLVLKVEW